MTLLKRGDKGTALTHDEADGNLTHLGGDGTYAMPTTDGDSGQVMSTNGSGQVSFTTLTGVTATIANAYPVGSIYMNCSNATNPGTLLGFGTWESFGAGRVLVGFDSGDSDFDTAEETGGSKTHTLTTAELPSHTHGLNIPSSENGGSYNAHALFPDGSSSNQAFTTDSTGSGSAHNNVQPYIVAYMWRRTA